MGNVKPPKSLLILRVHLYVFKMYHVCSFLGVSFGDSLFTHGVKSYIDCHGTFLLCKENAHKMFLLAADSETKKNKLWGTAGKGSKSILINVSIFKSCCLFSPFNSFLINVSSSETCLKYNHNSLTYLYKDSSMLDLVELDD